MVSIKPVPIWKKWMKDPKKREKFVIAYTALIILVNLLLVFGFFFFIYILYKRLS